MNRTEAIFLLQKIEDAFRADHMDTEADAVALAIYTMGTVDTLKKERDTAMAQPEIIRCKDCKYWMPHSQLGFDEDNETYHDYCERLIPEDEYYAFYRDADDYCSRAERRTDGRPD